jgi:hypothetical protein
LSPCAVRIVSNEVRRALALLARSNRYAAGATDLAWQFAVEIEELLALGVSRSELRWLVLNGYAEHARDATRQSDRARRFLPGQNTRFARQTCFILTAAGVDLAGRLGPSLRSAAAPAGNRRPESLPRWDAVQRALRVDGQVVKQFRLPAANQERVLVTFQEEGWPPRISDPLPPRQDIDPKVRLRDTVKFLNANQQNSLLRFHGDGTGEGVLWERVEPAADVAPARPRPRLAG